MLELLLALMLMQEPAVFGIQWDANTEAGLAGYRVYMGMTSGVYGAPLATIAVDTTIWHPPVPLAPGTYYLAVTAFDVNNNESGFSNEVVVTLPDIPSSQLENLRIP